jgi:hypothetical protein
MSDKVQGIGIDGKCTREGRTRARCIALDGKGWIKLEAPKLNLVIISDLAKFWRYSKVGV